jgi:hypothetical protein
MLACKIPMGSIAARRPAAAWAPTDIAGNIGYFDSLLGITLGTTMRLTGTSPAVTLGGTLTTATSLLVRIRPGLGGIVGTSQWEYSTDNGASYTSGGVTSTPAVAVGSTGFTVSFAAGTYVALDTYRSTVASWTDQNGGTNTVVQATPASQPLYVYNSTFGCNVVECSVALRLAKTTGVLTGDATHSQWARVRLTTTAAANQGFCAIGATNTSLLISHIGINGSNVLNYGTSATATPAGSTLVNGTIYSVGKVHTLGSTDQGYLNGATDGSALARTYNLSAGLVIGGRANAATGQAPAQHRKLAFYSVDPTAGEKTSLHTWLAL